MAVFIPATASAWFEIPVTDMGRAQAFYGAVLKNELALNEDGPNPIAIFASQERGAAGHVYPGKPAAAGTGPTIHLRVSAPLEEAMERVTKHGGQVVSPVITVPVGSFVYCLDPDGNSFGLFV